MEDDLLVITLGQIMVGDRKSKFGTREELIINIFCVFVNKSRDMSRAFFV